MKNLVSRESTRKHQELPADGKRFKNSHTLCIKGWELSHDETVQIKDNTYSPRKTGLLEEKNYRISKRTLAKEKHWGISLECAYGLKQGTSNKKILSISGNDLYPSE